jgi:hypothetical protein
LLSEAKESLFFGQPEGFDFAAPFAKKLCDLFCGAVPEANPNYLRRRTKKKTTLTEIGARFSSEAQRVRRSAASVTKNFSGRTPFCACS